MIDHEQHAADVRAAYREGSHIWTGGARMSDEEREHYWKHSDALRKLAGAREDVQTVEAPQSVAIPVQTVTIPRSVAVDLQKIAQILVWCRKRSQPIWVQESGSWDGDKYPGSVAGDFFILANDVDRLERALPLVPNSLPDTTNPAG